MPHIWDPNEGERRKINGIERAAAGAGAWVPTVTYHFKRTLWRWAEFTTDDMWWELDRYQVPTPDEPRAMGAVLSTLVREHYIDKMPDFRNSERAEAHRNPKQVWVPTGKRLMRRRVVRHYS